MSEALKMSAQTVLDGIRQFGLASDGSDLRDLQAEIDRLQAENAEQKRAILLAEEYLQRGDTENAIIVLRRAALAEREGK